MGLCLSSPFRPTGTMLSPKLAPPIWLDLGLFTKLVSTGWGQGSLVLVRYKSNGKLAVDLSRRSLIAWSEGHEVSFTPEVSLSFLFGGKNRTQHTMLMALTLLSRKPFACSPA